MTAAAQSYRAVLDRTHLLVTIFAIALVAGISATALLSVLREGASPAEQGVVISLVVVMPLLVVLAPAFFAPRGYRITESSVIVTRLGSDILIPRREIERAERIEKLPGRVLRTAGCGGLYGSFGWFHSSEIGKFRASITRTRDLVVLHRTGKAPFVISPERPVEFVAELGGASV